MKFKSYLAILFAELIAFAPISTPPVRAQTTTATQVLPGAQCFQATTGVNGMVGTIGTISSGIGYVNGTYGGVPLTGGSGSNATANITVSGGAVTAVTILNPGVQYVVGDVLSASAANLGGSGSGFSVLVASTSINSSLAQGSVAYYIPNTLTIKQTYQNAAQSVLNQNPVPLDANGCAVVYGTGTFRQILKDNLGNTVWDLVTSAVGSGSSSGGGTPGVGDGLFVGSIIPWAGMNPPTNYLFAAGQSVSRTSLSALFTAITIQTNITCSVGISSISVAQGISDTVPIGTPIESLCFVPGTTVTSKSSGLLNLSSGATITTSVPATLLPWGNGDGATTFNLPDLRGRVIAGRDNMGSTGGGAGRLTTAFFGNAAAIGVYGGSQSNVLSTTNLPPYTPSGTINVADPGHTHTTSLGSTQVQTSSGASSLGGSPNTAVAPMGLSINSAQTGLNSSNVTFAGNAQGGNSSGFATVQPTGTANYVIKVTPDAALTIATIGQLQPGNPNQLAGTDGSGVWGNVTVPTGLSVSSSALNFNIPALTPQVAPNANNDYVILYNAASNSTQRVAVGTIASAATSGVSSYNGLTGALGGANVQTTSYTIANTDCEKTVQLSSASLLTLTLPAVTGFPANCKVQFKNASASRGVKLSGFPAGMLSPSILWPNRAGEVQIVNNLWVITQDPGQWQPTGAVTLNVDNGGSDANDGLGLGAGALATPQKCFDILRSQVNLSTSANSIQPTCSLTAGQIFTGGLVCTSMGSTSVYFLIGNGGVATIRNTNGNVVVGIQDFCGYIIADNINADCTGAASHPCISWNIHQQNGSDLSTGGFAHGVTFTGANATDIGMSCDAMCRVNASAPITFAGTMNSGLVVDQGSSLNIAVGFTFNAGLTLATGAMQLFGGSTGAYSGTLTYGTGAVVGELFTGRGNSYTCIGSIGLSGSAGATRQYSQLNGASLMNLGTTIPGSTSGINSAANFGNGFVFAPSGGAGC